MKKYSLTFVIALFAFQNCLANSLFSTRYDWEYQPEFEVIDLTSSDDGAVVLKDLKAVEFYYDDTYQTMLQLYTVHSKVQVNNDQAIEMYNKLYMPMARVVEIEDLRARVITEEVVKEIEDIDLKDYEGEDSYSSYKYFAIEGVELGSQIEYIYTLKMTPQLEGAREFLQSDELKLNTEFHLYCQDKMFFKTKGYNGFPNLELDTSIEGKNHYFAKFETIEPLLPELYAPYNDKLMRLEYKLDYIEPAEELKLNTYDQISVQLNRYLKTDLSKQDSKAIRKLAKKLNLGGLTELEKIRKIEDYIKRNVTVSDQNSEHLEAIDGMLEHLVANERGIIKLYIAMLDLIEAKYTYGLTSDRSKVSMDPDFESYSFLENYLFYFPTHNKYMAPTEVLFRVGYIPFNWTNNYGLFISDFQEDLLADKTKIQFIEPLSFKQSEDLQDIKISFEGEFDALNIGITRKFSGYNATYIQPIFELIPEEETKLIVNELLNLSGKDFDLLDFNLQNTALDSFYMKPLVIQGKARTESSYYGKAGNSYLLKIGEVIGEQVEMYQEKERKLPVENEFNRNYERKIQFEIPAGYRVSNLEELEMNIIHEEDGVASMGFSSSYNVEGDQVFVYIKEYYKKLVYPVETFDQFRKIINAAADFNKKVLVFEKI